MIDLEQVKKRVEEIANTQQSCHRCEGKGRLWADGKIHRATYSEATVFCSDCGGSGKIRLDEAYTDELLTLIHDLIKEVEQLQEMNGVLARHGNTLQREKSELEKEVEQVKKRAKEVDRLPCGHGIWIVGSDERTHYCGWCALIQEKAKLKSKLLYGFYADQYPYYSQGNEQLTELHELATAEEVNRLVNKCKGAESKFEQTKDALAKACHAYDVTNEQFAKLQHEKRTLEIELLEAKKWLFDDNTVRILRTALIEAKAEIERLRDG